MKRRDNTLAYLFVTILTVMIWLLAAGKTKDNSVVTVELNFSPPVGSTSTITPVSATATVTFHGSKSGRIAASKACSEGLTINVPTTSGELEIDLASSIMELDAIRQTGVEISDIDPSSISLIVKPMVSVEAAVVAILDGIKVSGDITVNPATVNLLIPISVRDSLPEAIKVTASLSPAQLALLQPGIVHTVNAGVLLPTPLALPDVSVTPNNVSISFKIQKKTAKTTIPQVRVLIASPAEDYSGYSIELPRKLISDVTIEADASVVSAIMDGSATVFAIVRLATREMEQRIEKKIVTTFLAISEDGTGKEVSAEVEDRESLTIELNIKPIQLNPRAQ
ncbi:MAG: hypothetical protein QF444_03725 [Phycisphaerales bacterium]|nr:hypothetical protein [Phycisphaerales bacterium]MDP6693414.1 hypothetical protein [Phycisphaerales bacterium]